MPTLLCTREQLLAEARDRGRRWAEYRFHEFRGFVGHYLPSMLDLVTNRTIHREVADIVPLDALGDEIVEACYASARDTFNALVKKGKLDAKALEEQVNGRKPRPPRGG